MQSKQQINHEQISEYQKEREAVRCTMAKMRKELEKPAIRAVFERLRDR